MNYEIKGKIHKIFDTQQVTDSFKKREFVIDVQDGNYNQYIKYQLTQDRCDLLNNNKEGELVTVSFNIAGKEYQKGAETLYFTNLNAWRITPDVAKSGVSQSKDDDYVFPSEEPGEEDFGSDDGLPF